MTVTDHGTWWSWSTRGACAVFTGRHGGVSSAPWDSLDIALHTGDQQEAVLENRRRAASLLDVSPEQVCAVTQVHGADVWVDLVPDAAHAAASVSWSTGAASTIEADALVTTSADRVLAVAVADCMPIAIVWGDAVAAIHAGWRSLDAGVIEAALAVLQRQAGSRIATSGGEAVIGPCLGACCMEVGEEVAARFSPASVIRRAEAPRPFLDARADAHRRLTVAGIVVDHIDVCTRCDARLFSHRGDGAPTGRQALLVQRSTIL